MGRIVAIANQKGGVGKTTTAVNLSAAIAALGKKVLLTDLDPQGNATSGIGYTDKNAIERTLYDVMLNGSAVDSVMLTPCEEELGGPALRLIPSNRQLVGAEVELVHVERREHRLSDCLEQVRDDFDFILIDCPPSLSLLTVNGLAAADGVLITLQCEYYALEGLTELLGTIKRVRDTLNPRLTLEGVLMTMFQRTRLANEVVADVRRYLGAKVYQTVIPRNVTLSEAPSYGKPVIFYDNRAAGARAYAALAREIVGYG